MYAIIASTALLASTALASSVGSAIVVNKCNYDVTLCNVPAADGGFSEIDKTLSSGDTYTQQWTQLSNGDGWSIKLSNDTTLEDILQYEYTFHNDGTIWYDLSEVNGNPWDGNWEITASGDSTCSPKQQAYRYATDDAYGMQACPQDTTITVTLCSGESQDDGGAASASSSAAAETSSLATATSVSSYVTPTTSVPAYTYAESTTESSEASSTPAPTTLATSTSVTTSSSAVVSTEAGGATVTEVETAVVTNVVTYTHWHGHPHTKRAFPTGARHAHH